MSEYMLCDYTNFCSAIDYSSDEEASGYKKDDCPNFVYKLDYNQVPTNRIYVTKLDGYEKTPVYTSEVQAGNDIAINIQLFGDDSQWDQEIQRIFYFKPNEPYGRGEVLWVNASGYEAPGGVFVKNINVTYPKKNNEIGKHRLIYTQNSICKKHNRAVRTSFSWEYEIKQQFVPKNYPGYAITTIQGDQSNNSAHYDVGATNGYKIVDNYTYIDSDLWVPGHKLAHRIPIWSDGKDTQKEIILYLHSDVNINTVWIYETTTEDETNKYQLYPQASVTINNNLCTPYKGIVDVKNFRNFQNMYDGYIKIVHVVAAKKFKCEQFQTSAPPELQVEKVDVFSSEECAGTINEFGTIEFSNYVNNTNPNGATKLIYGRANLSNFLDYAFPLPKLIVKGIFNETDRPSQNPPTETWSNRSIGIDHSGSLLVAYDYMPRLASTFDHTDNYKYWQSFFRPQATKFGYITHAIRWVKQFN